MPLDRSALYSTVMNTSGGRKKFGFLPPHGRELAANEEYTVYGDIREAIIRFERTEARRVIIAFEQAIDRGDIRILHTPAPVLLDQTTGVSKMVNLNNGALGIVDPVWAQSMPGGGAVTG